MGPAIAKPLLKVPPIARPNAISGGGWRAGEHPRDANGKFRAKLAARLRRNRKVAATALDKHRQHVQAVTAANLKKFDARTEAKLATLRDRHDARVKAAGDRIEARYREHRAERRPETGDKARLQRFDANTEARVGGHRAKAEAAKRAKTDRAYRRFAMVRSLKRRAIESEANRANVTARRDARAQVRRRHEINIGEHDENPYLNSPGNSRARYLRRLGNERVRGHDPYKARQAGGHPVDDTVIYYGGEIKAVGEGKFGGYVVRWGSPSDADQQGDFFTPSTDFWGVQNAGVVYHHAIGIKGDPLASAFGKRRITNVTMTPDDQGLWAEGSLDLSSANESRLYDQIQNGLIGFSSGSASRLVSRKAVGGKTEITAWPIIEVSITPKPVEPRNRVFAMKAIIEAEAGVTGAVKLVDRTEALVADAEEIEARYGKIIDQRRASGRAVSSGKREAIKALRDRLDSLGVALSELVEIAEPRPKVDLRDELRRRLLADRIASE